MLLSLISDALGEMKFSPRFSLFLLPLGGGAWMLPIGLFCAGALLLAGSPQLREHVRHHSPRPAHSCAITLTKTSKRIGAIEDRARVLVRRASTVIIVRPLAAVSPVWIPKVFLEACRFEHGPPAPLQGALS